MELGARRGEDSDTSRTPAEDKCPPRSLAREWLGIRRPPHRQYEPDAQVRGGTTGSHRGTSCGKNAYTFFSCSALSTLLE